MSDDRLLLFFARRDLQLNQYRPGAQYSSYVHCVEKLFESRLLDRDHLISLCCSIVTVIHQNKSGHLVSIFQDIENQDDDVDDDLPSWEDDPDCDDQHGIEVDDDDLHSLDHLKKLVADVGVRYNNNGIHDPVIDLLDSDDDLALLIVIDNRLDSGNSLRVTLRSFFQNIDIVDSLLCENDIFCLDDAQGMPMVISDDDLPKPVYYPLQIVAAEQLVKRIEFILHHYSKRKLRDFDKFDFRIYTARSRMLAKQTINRVRNERAECFAKSLYENPSSLLRCAEDRVRMYSVTKKTNKELDELEKDARNNRNKLFLIVADEAHWGTQKQGITGESANSRFVNMWTDEHPNVIVLQVTATPWNLLTNNSRIPSLLVAEHRSSGDLLPVERRGHRGCVTFNSQDVTSEVGPTKELHVMQWNETLASCLKSQGLLMTLRVPQKCIKKPIWLCISKQPSQDGMYSWEGRTDGENAARILMRASAENQVAITSENGRMTLIIFKSSVGFVSAKTLAHLERTCSSSVQKYFRLRTDFNESVIELYSANADGRYLVFEAKPTYGSNTDSLCKVCGTVEIVTTVPHDTTIQDFNLVYHTLKFSFLIESQRQSDVIEQEQYLSLNFYYNSMRNDERKNQLIREDCFFQKMVDQLGKLQRQVPADVLAAEYAYYILMINLLHSISADDVTKSIEQLRAEVYVISTNFTTRRWELLKKMNHSLATTSEHEFQPIQQETFESVVHCITNNAREEFESCITNFELKKNISDNDASSFFEQFLYFYAHADKDDLVYFLGKLSTQTYQLLQRCLKAFDESEFSLKLRSTLSKSETFRIVNDLIKREISDETDGLRGHMIIIRAPNKACGVRLYATLTLARRLGNSIRTDYFFEVLRHFDKLNVGNYQKSSALTRIWQVLQRHKCDYEDSKKLLKCDCTQYKPKVDRVQCSACGHEHRQVSQFSDLDRLPCIIIVVEKGRLGDTFPSSLKVMDLRVRSQNQLPTMTSLMQELGRLCRYQIKPCYENYSELPYALVGPKVFKCLELALPQGAPIYCAFKNSSIDLHVKRKVRSHNSQAASRSVLDLLVAPYKRKARLEANFRHYDHGNKRHHSYRLLFQAEPQIGKTGVYLKTIALLRQRTEGHKSNSEIDSLAATSLVANECDDYIYSENDSDDEDESRETSAPGRRLFTFPYWKDMKIGKLKTEMHESKYSAIFGGYKHGKQPEYIVSSSSVESSRQMKKFEPGKQSSHYSTVSHVACHDCHRSSIPTVKRYRFYYDDNQFCRLTVPHLKRFSPLIKCMHQHYMDNREKHYSIGSQMGSMCLDEIYNELDNAESAKLCAKDDTILKTWIFNPTFGRAEEACINYSHTMLSSECNSMECSYVQILVVRPEEFDTYFNRWQATHAILQLPPHYDEADVNTGGVGYARRFIQAFAEGVFLHRIFVIDDNLSKVYAVTEASREVKNVTLFNVLRALESQFECAPADSRFGDFEKSPGLYTCACDKSRETRIHQYTGPSINYAVLGIRKSRQNHNGVVTYPFKKTHVYSLVLLNIKELKHKKIRYKCWQVHEDCNFNNDCDKAGLIVCKYNRFLMTKRCLTPWFPQIFVWTESSTLNRNVNIPNIAQSSGDKILRWLRQAAAPKRLQVVRVQDSDYCTIPLDSVTSHFLMKLQKLSYGKAHAVAFFDQSASVKVDMEQLGLDISLRLRGRDSANRRLESMLKYFSTTPGIGGFEIHLIFIHVPLCVACELLSYDDFKHEFINPVFDSLPSPVEFQVVTSHNIIEFRVPFVVVMVRGRIKNPFDSRALGNLGTNEKSNNNITAPTLDTTVNSTAVASDRPVKRKRDVDVLGIDEESSNDSASQQDFQLKKPKTSEQEVNELSESSDCTQLLEASVAMSPSVPTCVVLDEEEDCDDDVLCLGEGRHSANDQQTFNELPELSNLTQLLETSVPTTLNVMTPNVIDDEFSDDDVSILDKHDKHSANEHVADIVTSVCPSSRCEVQSTSLTQLSPNRAKKNATAGDELSNALPPASSSYDGEVSTTNVDQSAGLENLFARVQSARAGDFKYDLKKLVKLATMKPEKSMEFLWQRTALNTDEPSERFAEIFVQHVELIRTTHNHAVRQASSSIRSLQVSASGSCRTGRNPAVKRRQK